NGDTAFNGSTSPPVPVVVTQAITGTALTGPSGSTALGAPAVFTATVTVTAPGSGQLSGGVTFYEGTTALSLVGIDAMGKATYSTTALGVGPHTITAVYGGDGNFNGSTSPAVTVLVGSQNQRFVALVYFDVLRRPVDTMGLTSWTNMLDQ